MYQCPLKGKNRLHCTLHEFQNYFAQVACALPEMKNTLCKLCCGLHDFKNKLHFA